MKKLFKINPLLVGVLSSGLIVMASAWTKTTEDQLHTGNQTFEGPVDIRGEFSLKGEAITASAADINHLGTGIPLSDFTNLMATAVKKTDTPYTNTAALAASAVQPGAVASAPTNAVSHSMSIAINGTNYLVQLYPVND